MKCRNCKNNTLLDDGEQFSWCEIRKDNLDIDEERFCEAFSQATNADRIRSMTDEELADWLNAVLTSNVAPYATIRGANKRGKLLDWLKQEEMPMS